MTLFALLKGYTNFKDILGWMVFNTDNNALEAIFREYFLDYILQKSIAIDGKWLRGSDVNGQYTQESHKAMLNILDKDIKIVFAHKFLDKNKRSEIKALQEVLEDKLFSRDAQIFSFDALSTQFEILNTIDKQGKKYIAKLKGNQKKLKEKAIEIVELLDGATDVYEDKDTYLTEHSQIVSRKVELFNSSSCDRVMHHRNFNNIQSLIRVTKTLIDPKTGVSKETIQYLMANFKTTAEDFHQKIMQHWRVETYHYHLDMLTEADDHIVYKEPFSIAILRSFAQQF